MEENRLKEIDLGFLRPEKTKIFKGTFDLLHVMTVDGGLYRGVFAIKAFPVSEPDMYVSLFYHDEKDKVLEIGIIEDINDFPDDVREIILDALEKNYFAYNIESINSIKLEFGILAFDVVTDRGPKKFFMRWEAHRALEFGENGKILLDVCDDHYIVKDMDSLSKLDRELFKRYVYW